MLNTPHYENLRESMCVCVCVCVCVTFYIAHTHTHTHTHTCTHTHTLTLMFTHSQGYLHHLDATVTKLITAEVESKNKQLEEQAAAIRNGWMGQTHW